MSRGRASLLAAGRRVSVTATGLATTRRAGPEGAANGRLRAVGTAKGRRTGVKALKQSQRLLGVGAPERNFLVKVKVAGGRTGRLGLAFSHSLRGL